MDIADLKHRAGITEMNGNRQELIRAFVRSGFPLVEEMKKGGFTIDELEKINATVTTIGAWVQELTKQTPEAQNLDD